MEKATRFDIMVMGRDQYTDHLYSLTWNENWIQWNPDFSNLKQKQIKKLVREIGDQIAVFDYE